MRASTHRLRTVRPKKTVPFILPFVVVRTDSSILNIFFYFLTLFVIFIALDIVKVTTCVL